MTYMFILKCALKLVLKNILYYDARSEKHKKNIKLVLVVVVVVVIVLVVVAANKIDHNIRNRKKLLFHRD